MAWEMEDMKDTPDNQNAQEGIWSRPKSQFSSKGVQKRLVVCSGAVTTRATLAPERDPILSRKSNCVVERNLLPLARTQGLC
jgi:hypothetical protein